ncbi:hypothetical protein Glove_213g26 [Diversispora epigaea]|uniref:DUF659 domain-containing protein n=1 Tax=Diversispora epigaea TaxID=1348612 RepID=A0A397IMR4_9GLOM|nr:hypothetical protein Glove_213g26 [Diversispora epigaea]
MSDILYFIEEENENYYTQQDLSNNFLSNNSLSNNFLSNNPLSNNSLSDNSLSNNSLSEITANNQKKRKHPGEEASNIYPQNVKQPQITKHFDCITSVPITKLNEIDQAILKTIENPFIIDLFRIAISEYTLPSRGTLSGKLLDQETIRIEKKLKMIWNIIIILLLVLMDELLQDMIQSIIILHDSIYNYIVTISTRKEYLIKLKNYNIEKQTDIFMAEEIQKIMQNIGIEKFVAIVTDHGANLRVA